MTKQLLPKKAKDIKGAVAIAELKRAHYIIVILALSFAFIIGFATVYDLEFNPVLAGFAITLLVIVAAASLATAIILPRKK